MLALLKNHPFAVEAFFERSIVLTFAVPKESLAALIPESLELDTFKEKWAFIAMAVVQTKALRPKGFPKIMGSDFFLVGYRVFVQYTNLKGKRLRGLYILKSQTNKKKMEILGNIFTHYNYSTTDIWQHNEGNKIQISSLKSGLKIEIETPPEKEIALPPASPFADWKQARRYAGPLPFTFTYSSSMKEMLIIEGMRENWIPQPLQVNNYQIPFLNNLNIKGSVLANAFMIKDVPYEWKKGKREQWDR